MILLQSIVIWLPCLADSCQVLRKQRLSQLETMQQFGQQQLEVRQKVSAAHQFC